MVRRGKTLIVLALTMAVPSAGMAQTGAAPTPPVEAASPASQTVPAAELLKPEQLEALVAPIALYPDDLLANVLAASSYPLEVVQADRWLKQHKALKKDALRTEVDKQPWDDSVKALASTADVLAMMSDKVEWTKNLGDTFLAQQPDLMDAIQRLRVKAYDNKKLATTKQQKVSLQTQQDKQVVVIQSADPEAIYVPYYDPATVYGSWPYEAYPPYGFGYPSYIGAGAVAAGLAFGTAWAIGRWGNYWGGGVNWGNRNLYVNHRAVAGNAGWQHNPAHRQGVRYSNSNVSQRFGNSSLKAGANDRMDFRGRDGQQVLKPGEGAGRSAGSRGDAVGDRAGDRRDVASPGDRGKSGGDRAKSAKGGGERAKGGGDRAKGGGDRAKAVSQGGGGGRNRGGAMDVSSARSAAAASARGRQSMASVGRGGGGGAAFAGRGGGGFSGGGGGGFRGGGGGGGRRSDIALKRDIVVLGRLGNGIGYYRFSYIGNPKAYVGVMAQDVMNVVPDAVTRGRDGYLRVDYEKLGIKFQTYDAWLAAGARIPAEVSP
ncbi:hypothetical protein ACVIJ6_003631 [Bradyrhizobium sp. USDA 4369]